MIEINKLQKRLIILCFCMTTVFAGVMAQSPSSAVSFKTGQDWLADDGLPIDCHGGNIIYVDSLKTYFWYGEHYGKPRGAACYSSTDLYN